MSRDIYELLEKIIDKKVKGADTYINNGSRWLIFTDEKKWIFELTKEGTLWYNYYFFERIFKLISLNVGENQHHITKWVENFVQNGVKHTDGRSNRYTPSVEGIIQNGVKETFLVEGTRIGIVENTIQNAVKHIQWWTNQRKNPIEDTIQNGVKHTKYRHVNTKSMVDNTIQNGVKRTELGGKDRKIDEIKDIVENGIKETTPGGYLGSVEMRGKTVHQFETAKQLHYLEDVINDGIKEVKELPDKSGELNGYGEYYARQKNRTYPHNDIVNDVIRDGIKETKYCELHSLMRADHIIEDGVKVTNWRKVDNFPEFEERVIENGIKETWGYEKQPQVRVNEVINKGEKH